MAAGYVNLYTAAKTLIAQAGLNLGTASIAVALVTSSYTPNLLTDSIWSNASANEVANGNGYITGGVALGTMSSASLGLGILSAIASGGTSYVSGDVGKTVNIVGGTNTVVATVTITAVTSGAVTGIVVATPGNYSVLPSNPASTTGGGTTGSGLTITGDWGPVFTAGNVSWTSSTITAKYAVLVVGTAGSLSGTSKLLGYVDLNSGGGSVSTTNGTFAINWNNGVVFGLA